MREGIFGRIPAKRVLGALLASSSLGLAAGDPPSPVGSILPPPAFSADVPAAPLTAPTLPGQLPPAGENRAAQPITTTPTTPPATPDPAPTTTAPAAAATAPGTPPKWTDTHCGPQEQWWFDGGYRLWWVKDMRFSGPLVTTGGNGVPGTPGTVTLFGAKDVDYGTFNGLYLNGGVWLDCRHTFGLEMNGFYFGQQDVTSTFASNAAGSPLIARPFTDALRIVPAVDLVSSPGTLAGAVTVKTTSQLGGAGINAVKNLSNCEDYTIDTLFGFRYIDLEEQLNVAQTTTPINGGTLAFGGTTLPAGVGLSLADSFQTRNQFYGGLIGTRGEWRFGPVFIDVTNTIALGPNHEIVDIYGRTTALMPGNPTLPGGLLAAGFGAQNVMGPIGPNPGAPTVTTAILRQGNIGRYTTNRFVAAPEVGIEAGTYVTSHIRLGVGYNFLYMTDVARPGRQVDTQINTRFVPSSPAFGSLSGLPLPTVTGRREDFHAQGVQFTAEVKY